MLASGLGVYRFVMIGETSREQHQLVRPSAEAAEDITLITYISERSFLQKVFRIVQ